MKKCVFDHERKGGRRAVLQFVNHYSNKGITCQLLGLAGIRWEGRGGRVSCPVFATGSVEGRQTGDSPERPVNIFEFGAVGCAHGTPFAGLFCLQLMASD